MATYRDGSEGGVLTIDQFYNSIEGVQSLLIRVEEKLEVDAADIEWLKAAVCFLLGIERFDQQVVDIMDERLDGRAGPFLGQRYPVDERERSEDREERQWAESRSAVSRLRDVRQVFPNAVRETASLGPRTLARPMRSSPGSAEKVSERQAEHEEPRSPKKNSPLLEF